MGKIIKRFGSLGTEIEFDSGERAIITNSGGGGVKIKKKLFGLFLETVWICDNDKTLKRLTKDVLNNLDPLDKVLIEYLEVVSISLLNKYYSIDEVRRNL